MNSSDMQPSGNDSILDLFRSEVKTHGSILRDGLPEIVSAPDTPGGLDTLINAAKMVYGGARIVEADDIADLAAAIKDCLVAIRKGGWQLLPESADSLISAADLLLEMADTENAELSYWLTCQRENIRGKIAAVSAGNSAGNAGSHARTPASVPKTEISPAEAAVGARPAREPVSGSAPGRGSKLEATIGSSVTADDGMLDLYMEEVKSHTEVLNNGLLALENSPGDANHLEALMRSAHSIKGGARVVGLRLAVDCAHVMEDCFVAAQGGRVTLSPENVDTLLQGVDMLLKISEAGKDRDENRLAGLKTENDLLIQAVRAISSETAASPPPPRRSGSGAGDQDSSAMPRENSDRSVAAPPDSVHREVPAAVKADKPPENDGDKTPSSKAADKTRAIRVSAEKIERLMGLAGEVVVGASWLPPFSESLLSLKRSHTELYNILSRLQEMIQGRNASRDDDIQKIIAEARERNKESIQKLAERMNHLEKFTSTYATLSDSIYHEVISVRMRPFSDGVRKFPRLVRDLSRQLDKKVSFEIRGKNTEVDRDILEKLDAPLTHLIQNAVDHGIESREERLAAGKPESGLVVLQASHLSGMLMVTVSDDGRGIILDDLRKKIARKGLANEKMIEQMGEHELLDFLFLPGFSTRSDVTQISGRGVGLDVVQTMVREVGGVVRAETKPGEGLTFILELPLTLSVIRTFLVEISGELYAFPLARIDRCLVLNREEIETVESREYFQFDGSNIALVDIHDVLSTNRKAKPADDIMVLVLSDRLHTYGLAVDKFLGETDLVERPLDARLGKVPNIDAAAIMLDGSPVLIIDVEDMVRSIDNLLHGRSLKKIGTDDDVGKARKKRILVVDDSITVREMERKLLRNMGYEVEIAVDGAEGWNVIRSSHFDLVISDIDMPRMNGFEFVGNIKRHDDLKSIPVIIISYKDREEDRMRGLELGADYYLTKSSFEDNTFLDAVIDLIGDS